MTISRIHRCFKHISLYALLLVPTITCCMEQQRQYETIFDAANHSDTAAVARFITESEDPETVVNAIDGEGQTPLCLAARHNNLGMARLLLNHGAAASINKPDGVYGFTPLFWAASAFKNNPEMVLLLLEYGAAASINQPALEGCTPLHLAVMRNNPEMVRLLLGHGAAASINQLFLSSCWTPLHLAAYSNNPDMARLLLAHGAAATINQPDQNALTPLYWAACHDNLEMAHVLLACPKINFGLTDHEGNTAEEFARSGHHREIAACIHTAHLQQDALPACALAFACAMHPRVGADSPAHGMTQYILQDVFQLLLQYKMYQPEDDPSQAASSNVPARSWTRYCSIQ